MKPKSFLVAVNGTRGRITTVALDQLVMKSNIIEVTAENARNEHVSFDCDYDDVPPVNTLLKVTIEEVTT